jgi:hypothetical protein
VGIEVKYDTQGGTCSVRSLIPTFRYIEHGHVRCRVGMSGEVGGPAEAAPPGEFVGRELLGLKCGFKAGGSLELQFDAAVCTPYISCVGQSSSGCEWRFDKYEEPLFGRDISTWAIVALPSRRTELRYSVRYYIEARTFIFTHHYESDWVECECQLDT